MHGKRGSGAVRYCVLCRRDNLRIARRVPWKLCGAREANSTSSAPLGLGALNIDLKRRAGVRMARALSRSFIVAVSSARVGSRVVGK